MVKGQLRGMYSGGGSPFSKNSCVRRENVGVVACIRCFHSVQGFIGQFDPQALKMGSNPETKGLNGRGF